MNWKKSLLFFLLHLILPAIILPSAMLAQTTAANTDETKVPPYTLPDPLVAKDGSKIATAAAWSKVQKPWIYHLFEEQVYGRFPVKKIPVVYKVRESSSTAVGGKAIRKQVRIYFNPPVNTVFLDLLIYLPSGASKPVPVFAGYNFNGNQTIVADSAILLPASWMTERNIGVVNNKATAASNGLNASQWQLNEILAHGYGLATAYYGDIEPDHPEGWKTGIRTTLSKALSIQPEEWGAIGAWAWGLSRIMDYLQQDKAVDASKVAVFGHSRLGKAALWAGASDSRFAMMISNESGEGGAALSKRWYGETVAIINRQFPHWFVANYKNYNDNTAALPVDQHMLLALMAPRPLYIASAEGDQWSDPRGEFLSAQQASAVYELLGKKGIGKEVGMPGLQEPVGQSVRYHIRDGKHDVTQYDWQQYLGFADVQWKRSPK